MFICSLQHINDSIYIEEGYAMAAAATYYMYPRGIFVIFNAHFLPIQKENVLKISQNFAELLRPCYWTAQNFIFSIFIYLHLNFSCSHS